MSYEELTQAEMVEIQKVKELEKATLFKTPAEVSELYKEFGEVELSACALGYACRYKGLDHVKALVENGANFETMESRDMYHKYHCWGTNYAFGLLDFNEALKRSYSVHSGEIDTQITELLNADNGTAKLVLPLEERIGILRYLYENRERVCLEADELFFYAMIGRNKEIAAELKSLGATLSKYRAEMLTGSSRSFAWQEYCGMLSGLDKGELFEFFGEIIAEIGEGTLLHYTEGIYYSTLRRIMETDVFDFLTEHFNCSKMNKIQVLKDFVLRERVDCLAAAEKYGWLKQARRRDELIQYASDMKKTEAAAWLLDFKNRTADFAAEREKAEKKMMRELNADPNSVSELKKIWSYKKQEDGTLVITSYKGDKTEVTVPERIGKSIVAAIGDYAFSPSAPRLSREGEERRKKITKITLPDSIRSIGERAFSWCKALKEINIPDGITELHSGTFINCSSLRSVRIPDSVRSIGEKVFSRCSKLKNVNLPEGIPEIGNNAFSDCVVLEKIDIPKSAVKIGEWAFFGCRSLKNIVVPDGVTEIGTLAFAFCICLGTLELPASVKKIKNYKYRRQDTQTILHNAPEVTVIVPTKSYAEKYCERNNIPYKIKES